MSWPSINTNTVVTHLVTLLIAGVFLVGMKVITENNIETDSIQDKRLDNIEALIKEYHHLEVMPTEEKPSLAKRAWNWITFKEFRQ